MSQWENQFKYSNYQVLLKGLAHHSKQYKDWSCVWLRNPAQQSILYPQKIEELGMVLSRFYFIEHSDLIPILSKLVRVSHVPALVLESSYCRAVESLAIRWLKPEGVNSLCKADDLVSLREDRFFGVISNTAFNN